jgi:hypothetical protein
LVVPYWFPENSAVSMKASAATSFSISSLSSFRKFGGKKKEHVLFFEVLAGNEKHAFFGFF